MKHLASLFFVLTLLFTSCNSDNDTTTIPIDPSVITEEVLTHLHNDNFKKWRLTHYYSSYTNQQLDTDLTSCTQDEIYTFFSNTSDSSIALGNESCYANYQNVEEVAVAIYDYNEETKKLYLTFTRGINSSVNNVTSVTILTLKCISLTKNKMIFANGIIDEYGTGIIFEKI